MPANILNLPAYAITKVLEEEHDYHIYAEVVERRLSHAHLAVVPGSLVMDAGSSLSEIYPSTANVWVSTSTPVAVFLFVGGDYF